MFGEYQGGPDSSPRISVEDALAAASLLVKKFSDYAEKWIEREYMAVQFPSIEAKTTPMVGIGIHRAPVLFDYFGTADNCTFLAVGEHVSFAKTLASIAGTSAEFREKPILLHQSAEQHAQDVLTETAGYDLPLPGTEGRTKVFPVSKENLLL